MTHITEKFIKEELETEKKAFELGVPYINLRHYALNTKIVMLLPETVARRYALVAIELEENRLKVAMVNPLDLFAIEDLTLLTNKEIVPVMAAKHLILKWIDNAYQVQKAQSMLKQVEKIEEKKEREIDSAIGHLVDSFLIRCIIEGSSDLHIEPLKKVVSIRYRIDGQLCELETLHKNMLDSIVVYIKVVAGLDIAQRRLPQDGRLSKTVNGQTVDLRVSILPTLHGEKVVIRFIYQTSQYLTLEDIGFYEKDYHKMRKLLSYSHGIILLTGPTGSGKSTTLAASLRVLNLKEKNIVTVEDPIETRIEGINQVAVHNEIGLNFATALRAILRQDPDIIMIGEMRDSETSQIALRAALTGHLVLSTLHTNDAASAVVRLIDMGLPAYLVGATVKGIVSQRLIRKLCPLCKKKYMVTEAAANFYHIPKGTQAYKAVGCSACHGTGYKGRTAIHEVLVIDEQLQEWIAKGTVQTSELKKLAIQKGMRPLWDNALEQVLRGQTSFKEILNVVYEEK